MKGGVKEFKKAYKHVNIDDIEVGIIYINNLYKNQCCSSDDGICYSTNILLP